MKGTIMVTGRGIWSPWGASIQSLFEAALQGACPALSENVPGHSGPLALCRTPDPAPDPGLPQVRRMDRSAALALAAARAAHQEALLDGVPADRIAVVVGNSRGPAGKWAEPAAPRIRPTQATHSAVASLSGALSLAFGIQGPCLTVSATCASAAHAIALGALLIESGTVDAALVGGSEAPLVPALLGQFAAAGILGSHADPRLACRPFDLERNGTVPGEGAAFLVLESEASAARRSRVPVAVLCGAAIGSESHSRAGARPDGAGLARVMRGALQQAGLGPGDIGHVNAHGTGTRVNDLAEGAALRAVFGERLGAVGITSTKPITGHTFGAAAAMEAVLAIESLTRQIAPPAAGCLHPDPSLGLRVVHGAPEAFASRHVMSNSMGFWGNTASLIFGLPGR